MVHAFFDHVLAVAIWHEMAGERAALKAEEKLWRQFLIRRLVLATLTWRRLALTVIAVAILGFSQRSSACDFNLSEGAWL
jgi:hypothetical protein